jgi:hypothetical protein
MVRPSLKKMPNGVSGLLCCLVIGSSLPQAECHCCGKEQNRQNRAILVAVGGAAKAGVNILVTG